MKLYNLFCFKHTMTGVICTQNTHTKQCQISANCSTSQIKTKAKFHWKKCKLCLLYNVARNHNIFGRTEVQKDKTEIGNKK